MTDPTGVMKAGQSVIHSTIKHEVLEEVITTFLWYDMDHIEKATSNCSSVDAGVFVAVVTFLLSHSLAMIGGYKKRHTE